MNLYHKRTYIRLFCTKHFFLCLKHYKHGNSAKLLGYMWHVSDCGNSYK